jgi:hypothetical protein
MQCGSLTKSNRKYGPDVWQFRWSERGPQDKRVYRKRVIGTVERYSDLDAARQAVAGLLIEINSDGPRVSSTSMTIAREISCECAKKGAIRARKRVLLHPIDFIELM